MFKFRNALLSAACALGFGLAFGVTSQIASAQSCSQCWADCEAELYRCFDDPTANDDACRITYYSCGIGCGCEIP